MNAGSIRQKIAQAIKKMPTVIALYRNVKVDDGMGGYTMSDTPILIATAEGLLDNSKHSFISPVIVDAGRVTSKKTHTLILVYDSTFTVLKDDFFTVNGTPYKINNVENILNLNIYWDCDLEVILNS